MTTFEALIIGILQGITEFLPVSSSGHVLLFQRIFGHEEHKLTFNIVVHIGTLVPILIIYRERVISLIKNPFQKMSYLIILGTLPLVFAVLFFSDFIDLLFSGTFLAIGFTATGVLLLVSDNIKDTHKKSEDITYKDSICVGLIQMLAIAPGVSRSGSTIVGGLFCGLDRKTAANYSFLLAIPAIVGGLVLEIRDIITGASQIENIFTMPMFAGFFASMIAGFFAIKLMLKLVVKSKLSYFAYYMFLVAFLVLLDQMFIGWVF